jgi:arginyl-tRNA synthetase
MEEGWMTYAAGNQLDDEFWRMINLASQLESNIQISLQTAEPALVAKYLFTLAQVFNVYYHRHRIIVENDPGKKRFLLALTRIVRNQLELGLNLLGISVPEMM